MRTFSPWMLTSVRDAADAAMTIEAAVKRAFIGGDLSARWPGRVQPDLPARRRRLVARFHGPHDAQVPAPLALGGPAREQAVDRVRLHGTDAVAAVPLARQRVGVRRFLAAVGPEPQTTLRIQAQIGAFA